MRRQVSMGLHRHTPAGERKAPSAPARFRIGWVAGRDGSCQGPQSLSSLNLWGTRDQPAAGSDKAEYVPLAGLDCTGVTAFGAHDAAHLLCEPASGVILEAV